MKMVNIEMLMQCITYALIILGGLVLVVMVIVQGIKGLPGLKKIPTGWVVLIVSLILCILAVVIICQCFKIPMIWYYFVAAVIVAFFILFVATNGWDGLYDLWNRSKYKGNK